jgi:hypothetical protein
MGIIGALIILSFTGMWLALCGWTYLGMKNMENDSNLRLRLRDRLAITVSEVTIENWPRMLKAGWRHVKDYSVVQGSLAEHFLLMLVEEHGPFNVTVGDPWSTITMQPEENRDYVGLYVRDVESEIKKLRAIIESEGVDAFIP